MEVNRTLLKGNIYLKEFVNLFVGNNLIVTTSERYSGENLGKIIIFGKIIILEKIIFQFKDFFLQF